MDQETLFTGSKWDILKLLEKRKMSPIELAEASGTSMANISQQLRFLEMAGIVTSKRISNRDKGQPRILYSLSGNNSFLISVSPGFVDKRREALNERRKAILKIWFYDKKEYRQPLEKAFTNLDKYLSEIEAVGVDQTSFSPVKLTVVTNNGLHSKKIPDVEMEGADGTKRVIRYKMVRPREIKNLDKHYGIYDPNSMFGG